MSSKGRARDAVGLGLRMQGIRKESCSSSSSTTGGVLMLMSQSVSPHHPHYYSHLNYEPSYIGGGGGGGLLGDVAGGGGGDNGGGPIFGGTTSNRVGDIYDVVGTYVSGPASAVSGSSAVSKSLLLQQQLSYDESYSPVLNLPPSGDMTASQNVKMPFTVAQWQELERQTMIFKCLMASVPVPLELLASLTKSQSNGLPPQSGSNEVGSGLELGISSYSQSDPEPWRCKRTDGKKWRCSRDVQPDQKYCERHAHKARPRSRKHVESNPDSITNKTSNFITNNTHFLFNQKPYYPTEANCDLSMFPGATAAFSATSYDQPRSLEWFMNGETIPVAGRGKSKSNQEWQHLGRDAIKGNNKMCKFQHHFRQEQLNSNSCVSLRSGKSLQSPRLEDQCSLLLSPKSTSSKASPNPRQSEAQETRHFFVDEWSSVERQNINIEGIGKKGLVSSNEKLLPLSSLTLSMPGAGGSAESDRKNEKKQVGSFGIMASEDREPSVGIMKQHQWINPAGGSWMGSPPGGPLAEALCLGISSSGRAGSSFPYPHSSS